MANPTDTFREINLDAPTLATKPVAGTGTTIVGTLQVWNNQDYNSKLHGIAGVRAYEEVRRDPVVAAALSAIKEPVKSAKWSVAPGKSVKGKNGKMESSDLDRAIAEAAEEDFIQRQYGGHFIQPIKSLIDLLSHAMLMFDFGHAAVNVYWTVNETGRHVPEFLPINPQSVIHFDLDPATRSLKRIVQRAYGYEDSKFAEFVVPADDLELFVWRQEGDNYWGWAALREVFKPWDLKRALELIDATGLEKHACGVDEIHLTDDLEPGQEPKLQAVLQNVRGHERGGLLTPRNAKYELHSTGMNGTGVNPSIARLTEEILLALFSESLLMGGTSATGNRALGEVKQEDVHVKLQSIVNQIRSVLSQGTMRKWCIANFGYQKAWPMLECEPLDKMSGTVLAEILKIGKDAGVMTPGTKTEAWFRGIVRAPEEDDPYRDPKAPPPAPSGADPNNPNDPGGEGRPTPATAGKSNESKARLNATGQAYPSEFWRDAFPHERLVAFTDMKRWMDEEPLRIWHRTVKPIRDEQIVGLAKLVSQMTDAELATGALQPLLVKPLGAALATSLLDSYRRGRRSVLAEAVRSRKGIVSDENTFRFAAGSDDDEEDDPLYGEYPPEPTKKQATWITRLGQGLALGMTLKLVGEALRSGQMAQDQELPKPEVEAAVRLALGELSVPVAQADIGGKVVQAFTTGRVEQAKAMAEEITSVFYSSRLDSNTCVPCAAMDGAELDLDTYQGVLPNPDCDGGDRCRCEPVFVYRPATQREAA